MFSRHLAVFASFAFLSGVCAAADLNVMLREALDSGKRMLQLPDGELRVDSTLLLDASANGVKILGGKNTRLVYTQLTEAFYLNGCKDVTLKGFSIDYDPLCFTQGTVTSIAGAKVSFKVHDGYPSLTKPYLVNHALFFSKATRNWLWDATPNHTVSTEAIDSRNGVVTLGIPMENLRTGDFVCLNYRDTCAVKIRGLSGNLLFEDLDILSAPSGFGSRRASGSMTFRRVRILRGPTPAGATEPRLLAAGADGINIGTCRQGPLIEDCDFSFMGDDSVNFHGPPFPVVAADADSFTAVMGYTPLELLEIIRPGDVARILDPATYVPAATSEVVSIESLGPSKMSLAELRKIYPTVDPTMPSSTLFRIKLKGPVPKPGQLVDIPAINTPGFIIRNSRFHDHRARGLRIQASDGVVENCSFWNLEQSAISFGPEYDFWREAGWVAKIRISGNSISNVCQGGVNVSENSYFPGAIAIFARVSKGAGYPKPMNQDISITGNRIDGSGAAAIFINASKDVSVRDNRHSNLWQLKSENVGRDRDISVKREPIEVFASENVNMSGNREESPAK